MRADLFDRPDLRRRAGEASRHRQGRAHAGARRPSAWSASRCGCRARRARSWRRRRCSASTPTRSWPSSASARTRSENCAPKRRSEDDQSRRIGKRDRHERDGQDRQGALAQGRRRRLRGVQQSGAPQRDVARHVGRDRPHHGGLRQGRLAALRRADRRRREGLRVGRGHLALRCGALQRGGGRALQRAPRKPRASRSTPIRSPPSR